MIFTLVLIAIGILLFLVIGYNIVLQYKQKQQADLRSAVSRHRRVISETEDLLLNSARLPYSISLMLILHKRIFNALNHIQKVYPEMKGLKERLESSQNQVNQLQDKNATTTQQFRVPDNDGEAIQMLKVVKRLRSVIRSEHAYGRIATPTFIAEDRRLELMILKVNIENTIKRAMEAQAMRQWGTARQLLNKAINVINNISDKDEYMEHKLSQMHQMNNDMSEKLNKVKTQEAEERKEKDDLDMLFQPKKKW